MDEPDPCWMNTCLCLVTQSCLTLPDPMDYKAFQAPLSMGILQARILEWVAILFCSRSNLGLPHRRQTLYGLSHQGSP